MGTILVYAFITFVGAMLCRQFLRWKHAHFIVALAFPMGTCTVLVAFVLVCALPLPTSDPAAVSASWLAGLVFSLGVVLATLIWRRGGSRRCELKIYLSVAMVTGLVGAVSEEYALIKFGGDSWLKVDLHGNLFASWAQGMPVALQAMQSIKLFSGHNIVFGFIYLWSLSLIAVVWSGAFYLLRERGLGTPRCIAYSLVPVFFLFGNGHMAMQLLYYNHHILAATYVLAVALCFLVYWRERESRALLLVPVALLGLSLVRMEGVFVAVILLGLLLGNSLVGDRERTKVMALCGGLLLPLVLYLTVGLWSGGFVTGAQYGAVAAALFALLGIIFLQSYRPVSRFLSHLYVLVPTLLALGLIVALAAKPEHMIINLRIFAGHFFSVEGGGGWPYFWYGTTAMAVLLIADTVVRREFEGTDLWFVAFISLVVWFVVLGYFRIPYREGWSDSGNRMLVHVTPLLVLWLVAKFSALLEKPSSRDKLGL